VARCHLANEHQIPVRNISMLGAELAPLRLLNKPAKAAR
jgi:hypothetical protein